MSTAPAEKERVIPNFLNINSTDPGKWYDYTFSFAPIMSMYFVSICLGLVIAILKRNEPASKFKQPFLQILGLCFSCIAFVGFCVRCYDELHRLFFNFFFAFQFVQHLTLFASLASHIHHHASILV